MPPQPRRVTVAAGRLRGWLAGFGERHGAVTVTATPDVLTLSGADGAQAWVEVPFAPLAGDGLTDALVEHVERTRRVGVLLVRRGGHAAGVFQGSTLLASKVDSSYVQGTTKAGGWSQQRYARRRANQSRAAFADAADVAVRILLPAAVLVGGGRAALDPAAGGDHKALDAVVIGGDRLALDAVLADPRLAPVAALVAGPLLAVPDPRLRVLQATPEQFLAVRIRLLP